MDPYERYTYEDPPRYEDKIETLYPDSYRRIYPYIQDIADTLDDDAIENLTQADINRLAYQAINQSGIATRQSPYGGNVLGDLAGILLLRELFDRYDGRRGGYFLPFYPYPRRNRGRGRFGRY